MKRLYFRREILTLLIGIVVLFLEKADIFESSPAQEK